MKYFILVLFLVKFHFLVSQQLSGEVYDVVNGEPLYGASVYLDGSSIGTVTNEVGKFLIDPKLYSNTDLIVSFLGYETVSLKNVSLGHSLKIGLTPKIHKIPEVVLISDPFTRKQKLEVFRREFLGESKAARSCTILNEDDIYLYFNSDRNVLFANVDAPLDILNPYTGYKVIFDLIKFEIHFKSKSLNSMDNINKVDFYGHTLFKDDFDVVEQNLKRRKNLYLGSIQHLFKCMWNQNWKNENFEIRQDGKKVPPIEVFAISTGNQLYLKDVEFKGSKIYLKYKKNGMAYRSTLYLEGGSKFTIDYFGNYQPYNIFKFGGYMASLRIGDLLPLDYNENDFLID